MDTNAYPYGFGSFDEKVGTGSVEEFVDRSVAHRRQGISLALHEPGTIPKMTGMTADALDFNLGKSRGFSDVHIE